MLKLNFPIKHLDTISINKLGHLPKTADEFYIVQNELLTEHFTKELKKVKDYAMHIVNDTYALPLDNIYIVFNSVDLYDFIDQLIVQDPDTINCFLVDFLFHFISMFRFLDHYQTSIPLKRTRRFLLSELLKLPLLDKTVKRHKYQYCLDLKEIKPKEEFPMDITCQAEDQLLLYQNVIVYVFGFDQTQYILHLF